MFVFMLLQLNAYMEYRRAKFSDSPSKWFQFQMQVLGLFATGLAVVAALLAPTGYFGPLSSRIRGLFVQHTHTGNPLVDSVAEHQATGDDMYATPFLHIN